MSMKKTFALLAAIALLGAGMSGAQAQLADGDFTDGGLSGGWTSVGGTAGGATVYAAGATYTITGDGTTYSETVPTPLSGDVVFIQSTDMDGTYDSGSLTETAQGAQSATAAQLESALGVTLPPSNPGEGEFGYLDLAEYANGNYSPPPVNGQAITQTFNVTGTETLSFDWSMTTTDIGGFDGIGYSIDDLTTGSASYTQLDAPYYDYADPTPTATQTTSIILGPGTYTLGFAAYNTYDNTTSTGLLVSDVDLQPEAMSTPEPRSWMFGLLACAGLALVYRSLGRSETA
jgi:hypothetical protein